MATTKHERGDGGTETTGYESVNTTAGPRFMAMTRSSSILLKTEGGAVRWLKRRGYDANGKSFGCDEHGRRADELR